jgi:hypothetical protein
MGDETLRLMAHNFVTVSSVTVVDGKLGGVIQKNLFKSLTFPQYRFLLIFFVVCAWIGVRLLETRRPFCSLGLYVRQRLQSITSIWSVYLEWVHGELERYDKKLSICR